MLGAVALGARVIEKHFTDDTGREGPDHSFSMTPAAWREMVDRTGELERSLGREEKTIQANESETLVVRRRCLRAARDLREGEVIARGDLDVLRPAPGGSIPPYEMPGVLGRRIAHPLPAGRHLAWEDLA